ncbi:MAG: hypothetical protein CISAcid_01050 [uncultured Acidilobus sp. CIS]|jgi:hypothetical protein|nr:MAG: hypothetical protein CISAcid_01050 [uncultured Acidilobus sp. CIS]
MMTSLALQGGEEASLVYLQGFSLTGPSLNGP